MAIIEVQNLTKKFGEKAAVNGLSFDVEKNQIFGLLGTNGAGKSTTINILNGLLVPDKGKVKILGYDIKNIEKVRNKIALVPQSTSLYEDLTALENIEFFAGMYISDERKLQSSIKCTVNKLNIKNILTKQVSQLSGGYKRIVSIACALATNPKIVFFDEPLTGIDIHTNQIILNILEDLKKDMTIIFTTHSIKEAEKLCDYVFFIDKGQCFLQGKVSDIIDRYIKKNGQNIIIKFNTLRETRKFAKFLQSNKTSILNQKNEGKSIVLDVSNPNFGIKEIFLLSQKASTTIKDIKINKPNLEIVFNKIYNDEIIKNNY